MPWAGFLRRAQDASAAPAAAAASIHTASNTWPSAYYYSYSTTVCGRLIEVLSGERLDAFVLRRVTAPLAMADTSYHLRDADRARFMRNYVGAESGLQPIDDFDAYANPNRLLDGGTGMIATAGDYLRFARMVAAGGALDGVRVLRREIVALMMHPHIHADGQGDFGLGLLIGGPELEAEIGHPRGAVGFSGAANTYFWAHPERDEALVMMSQVFGGPGLELRRTVNDAAPEILA